MYCYILNTISSWHLYLLAAPFSKAYYLVGIPERTDKHPLEAQTEQREKYQGTQNRCPFFGPGAGRLNASPVQRACLSKHLLKAQTPQD